MRAYIFTYACAFTTLLAHNVAQASAAAPIPSLAHASASSVATTILAKINAPVPTFDQLSYERLLAQGVSAPTYSLLALNILHKLLIPQGLRPNEEIPYAQQKRKLALQLLPEIMQYTTNPRKTLTEARNVMATLAHHVPYWPEAALDFISFIQSQANILAGDEEQYLNELVSLIILRPTLWNRREKIDFMEQVAAYIVRRQQQQKAQSMQKYAQQKNTQREQRAVREQEAMLREDLAARGIEIPESKRIKKSEERALALPAKPFAKPLLDLINQLLFAAQHDQAVDRSQLNALTQFVFPDGSYTPVIFYIVQASNPEALASAIASGAPVEELNSDSINALIVAINSGTLNVIQPLLEAGIPISDSYIQNNTMYYRFNALISAIDINQLAILKILLAVASEQISDLMLRHMIIYAQDNHKNAAAHILKKEFQNRKGIELINAIANNDTAAIKEIVERAYVKRPPQLIIDTRMLELSREAAELHNNEQAYLLLEVYSALFSAISTSNVDAIHELLKKKAQHIDLEMLGKLLQAAHKNGYAPLVKAIQDAINNYNQQAAEALHTPMEE